MAGVVIMTALVGREPRGRPGSRATTRRRRTCCTPTPTRAAPTGWAPTSSAATSSRDCIYAGRVDLLTAFFAVFFPFCIGTALGCLAGYYGRFADTVVMRLVDVVVAFPFIVLVLALVFVLGPGQGSIIIAITAVGWVSYARIVRGEILVQKRLEYVLAARAAGLSDARIIARHLLPNVITQAIVFSMSDIVLSVLAIVTLSYLGAGIPPPTADWGSMIADGESLITTQWQIATFPGFAILLTGLGLSLLGDGLADLLAPE